MNKTTAAILITVFLFFVNVMAIAQCAMCRASVENSISENSDSFGASLNTGILYLFAMPYLLITLIAFFWFRASRKNQRYFELSLRNNKK
jgi:hypothetical protein